MGRFFSCYVEIFIVYHFEREESPLKSFLLPVGRFAGSSLSTLFAAMSCGATLPVNGLDIVHLSDQDTDPVLRRMVQDLNQACDLLRHPDNTSFFPSSFSFESFRPQLPGLQELSVRPSASALLDALRGKGIPLSYKTDREAVEWAFSVLLSDPDSSSLMPLRSWINRIRSCIDSGEDVRVAILSDLCDPFSTGVAFAVLSYLHEPISLPSSSLSLFCVCNRDLSAVELSADTLSDSLRSLTQRTFIDSPVRPGNACAGAAWLMAMPASFVTTPDSVRLLYTVLARQLAVFFSSDNNPAPGLHTVSVPGILTLHSLGDRAEAVASFIHLSAWLLCDLIPALKAFFDHPAPVRSLSSNTRNGLFRRLFSKEQDMSGKPELLTSLQRAVSAVMSEVLSLIRYLPGQFRLATLSDPLWRQTVDACGRTVTVSSEYDVSMAEAREGGILDIKPVHRVSMADTEEEKLEQRLSDICIQFEEEKQKRDKLFDSVGNCWAILALKDCRNRCIEALNRATRQLEFPVTAQTVSASLSSAAIARRVRLLEAAVSRCNHDLTELKLKSLRNNIIPAAWPADPASPFASELLNAEAAEKLFTLLTLSGNESETVRKELQALMPSLFCGFRLSDTRSLVRQLVSACNPETSSDSVRSLILAALSTSCNETHSLRFVSTGDIPPILLLPDLYPDSHLLTVEALLSLLPGASESSADTDASKRGLLSMLLLRQYRRRTSDESALSFEQYEQKDSPVLRAWLSSHGADRVWIAYLGSDKQRLPFALILPGHDLIPARLTASHVRLLPGFSASWFNSDSLSFSDPCERISEGDRCILLEVLSHIIISEKTKTDSNLIGFLDSFRCDLTRSGERAVIPDHLGLRIQAALGLRPLPAFSKTLLKTTCTYEHFLPSDTVAGYLADQPDLEPASCMVPDDVIYLYRDVPFARESSRTLLESIPLPAEEWILNLLDQECHILSRASDDYHDSLVSEIGQLLDRYPDAVPEAREIALSILEEARQSVTDTETELFWPWDPLSPSIRTILTECLGETLADYALHPFSDRLTLFPARGNEIIGDTLMATMCQLPAAVPDDTQATPAVMPDAVLPPFSAEFCAALCRLPEGRTLLRPGLLSFDRNEDHSVRATILLEGSFPVRLSRDYTEDQLLNLYSHDIPTLAVWPNLPFPPEDWQAYFIYSWHSAGLRIDAYTANDETIISSGNQSRYVSRSAAFPLSFSFFQEDVSIGSIPNLLPAPVMKKTDAYTACVDFGSAGTSVVFSVGHNRHPLQGPSAVRTLLNNPSMSRDLLRKEFLPAVHVSALLPTVSRIFRNVPGVRPLPFEDGVILMTLDLQDVFSVPSGSLYTCMKWEEDRGRSVTICLHQIMLMTALQARSEGAASLSWRFALPDEMAAAGRERLAGLFSSLAALVSDESGFGLPEKQPLVTFASESSALGAYFRLCASEDTRGGFMVMDIGSCTADISLFLRGSEQAVRTCQVPLGIHYMMLPSLLRDPGLLQRDLEFVQDPSFRQDIMLLGQIIHAAPADPAALRHLRLSLDSFIADRFPLLLPGLLQNPLTGMPTRIGSLLLLYLSYLMMMAGLILLQIAADPGKNDFLPEQMSLCLSGRGALLPESLPDQYKTALWHFLTMFRNRHVASLSFLFSSEKKMEIPVGLSVLQEVSTDLPPASTVPAAISVRPEELLPRFVLQFAKEFPASAEILFHGFFTADFYHPFTSYGESVITEAINHSFTEQTAHRPYDALSAWIGSLMELIDNSAL